MIYCEKSSENPQQTFIMDKWENIFGYKNGLPRAEAKKYTFYVDVLT